MLVNLPGGLVLSIPAPVMCVLFILGMLLIAQAGLWLFNKWHRHEKFEKNNEVAGIIFGAVALIYSLILTFVIVAEWDDYNELDRTIQAETDGLNSILAHSSTLPDTLKELIINSIDDYCNQVINQEWKMQEKKLNHPSAIPILRQALLTTVPENVLQQRILDALDEELSNISDLHRQRLTHTHSQMPSLIWQILKAGTVLLILFSYFFHVSSIKLKRVYLSFLVASVSMCMFLVYSLDHPFDEQDGVSNQSYRNVQKEIRAFLLVPDEVNTHIK